MPDWRQAQYHQRMFKRQLRRIQNTRRRKGNGEAYEAEILTYLNSTQNHIERAKALCDVCSSEETQALRVCMGYAVTLSDCALRTACARFRHFSFWHHLIYTWQLLWPLNVQLTTA